MVPFGYAFTSEPIECFMAGRARPGPAPAPRLRRLAAVMLLVSGTHTSEDVAKAFGVSRFSVYHWRKEFLADPRPDCDLIRRMVNAGRRLPIRLANAG